MKYFHFASSIVTVTACLALGNSAFATTETFAAFNNYDTGFFHPGDHLDAVGFLGKKMLTDTFDLTSDGFLPGVDIAVSGTATFDILDLANRNNREKISIDLGSISEVAGGQVQDYSVNFDSSDLAGMTILTDINADGILGYTITATKGNFFVTDAELDVTATVPDGGATMALLGLGLLGLSGVARKLHFR